jgi:hypothetical protein
MFAVVIAGLTLIDSLRWGAMKSSAMLQSFLSQSFAWQHLPQETVS